MKRILLPVAFATLAFSVSAQESTVAPGEYFLRHVATGKYFTSGIPWGTAGVLGDTGRRFTLSTSSAEGCVNLKSTIGDGQLKLGDVYMDGSDVTDYKLVAADRGYLITAEQDGATVAVSLGESQLRTEAADPANDNQKWEFVTEAELLAGLAAATKEAPVDATFAIRGFDVAPYDKDNDFWTVEKLDGSKVETNIWGGEDWDNKDHSFALICDNSAETVAVGQVVSGLPAGYYTVSCQICCWNATSDCTVNDVALDVASWPLEEDLWHQAFTNECAKGGYDTSKVVYAAADGKLTIRMAMNSDGNVKNRLIFDNYKLMYHGVEDPSDTGVRCVSAISADEVVNVYSADGVMLREGVVRADALDTLPAGLYILSNGTSSVKIMK